MTGLRDVGMSYHGNPTTEDNGYGIMQDFQRRDPRVSFMSVYPVSAWSFPRGGLLATSRFICLIVVVDRGVDSSASQVASLKMLRGMYIVDA